VTGIGRCQSLDGLNKSRQVELHFYSQHQPKIVISLSGQPFSKRCSNRRTQGTNTMATHRLSKFKRQIIFLAQALRKLACEKNVG
jgi:hypothetical protein